MSTTRVNVLDEEVEAARNASVISELLDLVSRINEKRRRSWPSIEEICNGEWSIGGRR